LRCRRNVDFGGRTGGVFEKKGKWRATQKNWDPNVWGVRGKREDLIEKKERFRLNGGSKNSGRKENHPRHALRKRGCGVRRSGAEKSRKKVEADWVPPNFSGRKCGPAIRRGRPGEGGCEPKSTREKKGDC